MTRGGVDTADMVLRFPCEASRHVTRASVARTPRPPLDQSLFGAFT